MTVREQIIDNLYNGLSNITVANGYDNTIAEVRKGIVNSSNINSFPILTVQPGSEVLQTQIEGQQEGIYSIDCYVIGYANTNDITTTVESLISDVKRFFYKDTALSLSAVCSLLDINYIQGYVIKEINPYLAYTNNIVSFGILLKIEYVDFYEPTVTITLNPPTLVSPANNYTSGTLAQALDWSSVTSAQYYHIRVYNNSGVLTIDQDNLTNTSYTIPSDISFSNGNVITWKVRAKAGNTYSDWSTVWSYTINDTTVIPKTPLEVGLTDIWVRGDDITLTSGAVSSWNDKSGNGRHLTNSTTGNRPITETLSGKTFVKFEGTLTAVRNLSVIDSAHIFKITGTQTRTFCFTIMTRDNTPGRFNSIMARSNNGTGDEYMFRLPSSGGVVPYYYYYTFLMNDATSAGCLIMPENVGVLRQVIIEVNSTTAKLFVDGVLVSTATLKQTGISLPATATTFLVLGGIRQPNATQGTFAGAIGEFSSGAVILTATQKAQLYKYHQQYYGV